MKVVHLLPALEQGGVETVVCDLVKALGGEWESVVVSKGGRLVERVERAGGRHVELDLKSKNPLTYFARAWKLRKALLAEKPDLVCVHSRVPAWLFVWANRGLGLRWITYAHGANSVSRYSEVMTKGDLVITPSRFLADYLKANYGMSEGKIRVIPISVDAERFDPDNLDQAFIAEKRREWGICDGDRVIMAIGRITPVKGLENLIREFAKSKSQISNLKFESSDSKSDNRTAGQSDNLTIEQSNTVKLIIVGGTDRHHLKYLQELKNLASAVHPHLSPSPIVFAGPQEKIPECIAIADEIVSANVTKPETFGLSIVEAYAMNKPVRVMRRFGGAAEVMDAVEKAGSATLREAALSLYGSDKFAARTLAVYREAVG